MKSQVEGALARWVSPAGLKNPALVARMSKMIEATPVEGYLGWCNAIRGLNVTDRLKAIKVPTRVVVREIDPATPGRCAHHSREHPGLRAFDRARRVAHAAERGPGRVHERSPALPRSLRRRLKLCLTPAAAAQQPLSSVPNRYASCHSPGSSWLNGPVLMPASVASMWRRAKWQSARRAEGQIAHCRCRSTCPTERTASASGWRTGRSARAAGARRRIAPAPRRDPCLRSRHRASVAASARPRFAPCPSCGLVQCAASPMIDQPIADGVPHGHVRVSREREIARLRQARDHRLHLRPEGHEHALRHASMPAALPSLILVRAQAPEEGREIAILSGQPSDRQHADHDAGAVVALAQTARPCQSAGNGTALHSAPHGNGRSRTCGSASRLQRRAQPRGIDHEIEWAMLAPCGIDHAAAAALQA